MSSTPPTPRTLQQAVQAGDAARVDALLRSPELNINQLQVRCAKTVMGHMGLILLVHAEKPGIHFYLGQRIGYLSMHMYCSPPGLKTLTATLAVTDLLP